MPTVVFEKKGKPVLTVSAPEGGSIQDMCDDHAAPVPFSCRSACCGTCRVEVLEGAENLDTPEDEELDVLDAFGQAPPKHRLACCAKMKAGGGTVRVQAVDE